MFSAGIDARSCYESPSINIFHAPDRCDALAPEGKQCLSGAIIEDDPTPQHQLTQYVWCSQPPVHRRIREHILCELSCGPSISGMPDISTQCDFMCHVYLPQEMANPRVRPHFCFYPEDAGNSISEYWHAKHWHESADPDLVTPLATINGHPFFVYEPCLLTNGCAIIPHCWFVCDKSIMAHAWLLHPIQHSDSAGWIVEEFTMVLVSQDELLVPFGLWATSCLADGLPDATCIIGTLLCDPFVDLNRT